MKYLMLKLLTYEPFEKISGDEKEYVDRVLNGSQIFIKQNLLEYHDFFRDFMSNLLYTPQDGINMLGLPVGKRIIIQLQII